MLKIKTFIRRFLIKILKLERPCSLPYITGDSFRSIAQHILDESVTIKPEKVTDNEIIFVRTNYLNYFFKKIYPKISCSFILITHNEDLSPKKEFVSYLNENKIIHWFAENCIIEHPKITPIPIGLYNQYNDNRTQIFKNIKINAKKNNLVAYGFNTDKNNTRLNLKKNLQKNNLFNELIVKDYETYIKNLSTYKFVISPEGKGIDCHRTWESMLIGVVPILIKNQITIYWEKIGLPVLLINTWSELNNMNDFFLNKQYDIIMSNHSLDPAFFGYWQKEIFQKINTNHLTVNTEDE